MKIGNIYFENELINHEKVKYINYVKKDNNINFSLPNLFVGWKYTNRIFSNFSGFEIDILTKKIDKRNFWEFSFEENKSHHVSGVEMFIINAPIIYFGDIHYYSFDPIFYGLDLTTEKIVDKIILENNPLSIYNYKNEMIYVFYNPQLTSLDDRHIIGYDLNYLNYLGYDVDFLLNAVSSNIEIKYTQDVKGNIYKKYSEMFTTFSEIKRYIPFILWKEEYKLPII